MKRSGMMWIRDEDAFIGKFFEPTGDRFEIAADIVGPAWSRLKWLEVEYHRKRLNDGSLALLCPAQFLLHLQSLGIPVVHDLPGVGSNLIDHYVVRVVHRVRGIETVNEVARWPRVLPIISPQTLFL